MAKPAIERAYELARAGEVADLVGLKRRLKAEGCRAVDALLAPRGISSHLIAICTAAYRPSADNSPENSPERELA